MHVYLLNRQIKTLIFCTFILLSGHNSFAQLPFNDTSLIHKFELYHQVHKKPSLFLHCDKTFYTNNEEVWFTAYLINNNNKTKDYKVLSVALVNNETKSIYVERRFSIINNSGSGLIIIPDSIPTGNYTLHAYLNQLDDHHNPVINFEQPLIIKSTYEKSFKAKLKLDSLTKNADRLMAILQIDFNRQPKAHVSLKYRFDNQDWAQLKYIPENKEYPINIPLQTLPRKLFVEVNYQNEREDLSIIIPSDSTLVNFYPDGGVIPLNSPTKILWDTHTINGRGISVNAVLLHNEIVVDSIVTDKNGNGCFLLTAKKGNYEVRLVDNKRNVQSYKLPLTSAWSPKIDILDNIVNDTLRLRISGINEKKLALLVHNETELLNGIYLKKSINPLSVVWPLDSIPKGVTILTIIDSNNHPLAQKLFFAHYKQRADLLIETDKEIYGRRQGISMTIQLLNGNEGKVSVAVVHNSRINPLLQQNIECFNFFEHILSQRELPDIATIFNNKGLLSDAFLRYHIDTLMWKRLSLIKATDTLQSFSSPTFEGLVTRYNAPLKKPVAVTSINGANIGMLMTDSKGKFRIPDDYLMGDSNKPVLIVLNGNDRNYYRISVSDPYKSLNANLATRYIARLGNQESSYSNISNSAFPEIKGVTSLKEVKITASSNIDLKGVMPKHETNECGDYICIMNGLNCPIPGHCWFTSAPIKGQYYRTHEWVRYGNTMIVAPTVSGKIYEGCELEEKAYKTQIDGIYSSVNFPDAATRFSFSPFSSTLFWENAAIINNQKKAVLKFNTNDLTGVFKIIVQGIVDNRVVYSEKYFQVLN